MSFSPQDYSDAIDRGQHIQKENNELKATLISKYLENWSGLSKLSIESYFEHGKISGTLRSEINKMLDEYAENVNR